MPRKAKEPVFDDDNPEWTEADFAKATKFPSGIKLKDLKPGELLMLPWAEAQVKENQTNLHKNDPMVGCLPPGVPRINLGGSRGMPHPFKVVQTPTLVVLLYETSTNQTFRQVFLDGRPLPADPQPTWLGYSIGRWEGDTLVVESAGFNGRAWVDTGSASLSE